MTIPIWNPETLSYELPPTQYYGLPLPFIEVLPCVVMWSAMVLLIHYTINKLDAPLTFMLATLCQAWAFSLGVFVLCWWDFQNTMWNCVPQINFFSFYGLIFAVSIFLHYAVWGSYYFIVKRMKKGKEAEE